MVTKAELIRLYQDTLFKNGPSSQAVQYADEASHHARFDILSQIDTNMTSILDVGCGLAEYCHYLRAKGNPAVYKGIDIVPEFVDLANLALTNDPNAEVCLTDAETGDLPQGYDYAILSGVFNNKMSDNWSFMSNTLVKMFSAANKGIAFNAMSSDVDYRDPALFYVDPIRVYEFCKKRLGGHPVLRHDYVLKENGFPFEFAMYVYKEPQ